MGNSKSASRFPSFTWGIPSSRHEVPELTSARWTKVCRRSAHLRFVQKSLDDFHPTDQGFATLSGEVRRCTTENKEGGGVPGPVGQQAQNRKQARLSLRLVNYHQSPQTPPKPSWGLPSDPPPPDLPNRNNSSAPEARFDEPEWFFRIGAGQSKPRTDFASRHAQGVAGSQDEESFVKFCITVAVFQGFSVAVARKSLVASPGFRSNAGQDAHGPLVHQREMRAISRDDRTLKLVLT